MRLTRNSLATHSQRQKRGCTDVNVDNIFDKDYLGTITPTTNTPATFRPGPDRTFQLTLTAKI